MNMLARRDCLSLRGVDRACFRSAWEEWGALRPFISSRFVAARWTRRACVPTRRRRFRNLGVLLGSHGWQAHDVAPRTLLSQDPSGSGLPAYSATMYSAYQFGQFSIALAAVSLPMRDRSASQRALKVGRRGERRHISAHAPRQSRGDFLEQPAVAVRVTERGV